MVISIKKAAQIEIIPNTTELATHARARAKEYIIRIQIFNN
mgnify:CR=1 FL=1